MQYLKKLPSRERTFGSFVSIYQGNNNTLPWSSVYSVLFSLFTNLLGC